MNKFYKFLLSGLPLLTGCPIDFESKGNGLTDVSITNTTSGIITSVSISTTASPTTSSLDTVYTSNLDVIDTSSEKTTGNNDTENLTSATNDSSGSSTSEANSTSTGQMSSVCGNLIVESPEECDDGQNGSDICNPNCTFSICGDGISNPINEDCDDLNKVDDDSCSNDCIKPRIVFLTTDYIGPPDFGGIKKADQFCQANADLFNIPGTFMAWLSDSDPNSDPVNRFGSLKFEGWYQMPGNPPVNLAKTWFGLEKDLLNPLNIMPTGLSDFTGSTVWTNTNPLGKAQDVTTSCDNWTSKSPILTTVIGYPQKTNISWTLAEYKNCSNGVGGKLYCFQVD